MTNADCTPEIFGGGGVIWRVYNGSLQVVLVHHGTQGDWSIPKGKQDPGEDIETCAVREVLEETGLHCETDLYIGAFHYIDRYNRTKVVQYWSMHAGDDEELHVLSPTMEIDDARWVNIDEAVNMVTISRDRLVLCGFVGSYNLYTASSKSYQANLDVAKAPFLAIRHGSAGDRGKFKGSDQKRPLDEKGTAQASRLAIYLAQFPIDTILSSPAARCTQTVEPFSQLTGLSIETTKSLGEGSFCSTKELLYEIMRPGTLVCTHGDVLEHIVNQVAITSGLTVPGLGELKKASMWIFNGSSNGSTASEGPRFKVAGYLPPPRT